MIMFKYIESSINVCRTKANKFHLENLFKYTKSQHIKIPRTVHDIYYVPISWAVKHSGIKILRRKNET